VSLLRQAQHIIATDYLAVRIQPENKRKIVTSNQSIARFRNRCELLWIAVVIGSF
jgi:hypothetical protein